MGLKKRVIAIVATVVSFLAVFLCVTNVQAASADMVDVSNNNGGMTVSNFKNMHDNYGIKAMVTKISEGTSFKDADAAGNISAAQSAGLYVNGYHYARYSTVAGAKAEADFAGRTAQADGLPAGAVLATDVESSEQSSLSTTQNNANNQAFMTEVAKYGYRSTIYTMGSWVGTVMNVDSGWIAAYPYSPAGQEWYTANHGWQWTSTYTFSGSYGNFDVSELYDNFFTSYESPEGTTASTDSSSTDDTSTNNSSTTTDNNASSSTGVINVNSTSSDYVPLVSMQSDGSVKNITNRALGNRTNWKTDQTKDVSGVKYYRVATNEWVSSQYVTGNNSSTTTDSASQTDTSNTDVVEVDNSGADYVGLMSLQSDGTMKNITNRALGNNTNWKTDQTKEVNGVKYYRVATNEWVASTYVIS